MLFFAANKIKPVKRGVTQILNTQDTTDRKAHSVDAIIMCYCSLRYQRGRVTVLQ